MKKARITTALLVVLILLPISCLYPPEQTSEPEWYVSDRKLPIGDLRDYRVMVRLVNNLDTITATDTFFTFRGHAEVYQQQDKRRRHFTYQGLKSIDLSNLSISTFADTLKLDIEKLSDSIIQLGNRWVKGPVFEVEPFELNYKPDSLQIWYDINLDSSETSEPIWKHIYSPVLFPMVFNDSLAWVTKTGHEYPNPFCPITTVSYEVPRPMSLIIVIYNMQGEIVDTLLQAYHDPGVYERILDIPPGTPSGVYFLRFIAGDTTYVKKIVLTK